MIVVDEAGESIVLQELNLALIDGVGDAHWVVLGFSALPQTQRDVWANPFDEIVSAIKARSMREVLHSFVKETSVEKGHLTVLPTYQQVGRTVPSANQVLVSG